MKYLKRDIYQDLLNWKKVDTGKVLQLSGARQVGKTYILTKFAKENYKKVFYINLMQSEGEAFIRCIHEANAWEPGEARQEKPLHRAITLYANEFTDDKDTIVIIDEIQESAEVFSLLRQFAREFQCHFVVTGSYLGQTFKQGYFFSVGDVDLMTLDTLSYPEFLDAFGKRDVYDEVDLYGESIHEYYDELKSYYNIYFQIGGYPEVVNTYIETKNVKSCENVLDKIIKVFLSESGRYFHDVLEIDLLDRLLPAIAQTMVKEKKGSKDLVSDLSKIIFKEESNRISKKSINAAIAWFYRSRIIGYCGMVPEGNILDMVHSVRFYFMDLGISRYFLNIAGAPPEAIAGILSENFVFRFLLQQVDKRVIAGAEPLFSLYKEGEVDFFVNSRLDYCNYAVEVKSGKTAGRTANLMLSDKKVDFIIFLKGDTYGGISDEKKYTIPIYLTDRICFDKGQD